MHTSSSLFGKCCSICQSNSSSSSSWAQLVASAPLVSAIKHRNFKHTKQHQETEIFSFLPRFSFSLLRKKKKKLGGNGSGYEALQTRFTKQGGEFHNNRAIFSWNHPIVFPYLPSPQWEGHYPSSSVLQRVSWQRAEWWACPGSQSAPHDYVSEDEQQQYLWKIRYLAIRQVEVALTTEEQKSQPQPW